MTAAVSMAQSAAAIGLLAAGLALLTGIFAALRKSRDMFRRIGHLIDDLAGEPSRPGVPKRPGVMERLANLEQGLDDHMRAVNFRLSTVEHATAQLLPNGGSHLADAVNRMEQTQRANSARAGDDVADLPSTD